MRFVACDWVGVMSSIFDNTGAKANAIASTSESGKSIASTSESDDCAWFTEPARHLLGSDPGLALHYLSEEPESTCRRIFRGHWPSLFLYRKLLWKGQGWTWLAILMDGCEAPWWREIQAARDLLIKFKIELR